jgi:hypothetical protein
MSSLSNLNDPTRLDAFRNAQVFFLWMQEIGKTSQLIIQKVDNELCTIMLLSHFQ